MISTGRHLQVIRQSFLQVVEIDLNVAGSTGKQVRREMTQAEELYPGPVIGLLKLLRGRGWLSPGGVDCLPVSDHGAAKVTGIDVEAPVLETVEHCPHHVRGGMP